MTITINNKEIKTFNFSGGECYVSIENIDIGDTTKINAYLYNSDDIMRLIMTVDAVRQVDPTSKIDLTLPYFPYARQDRVCNAGEAFSAYVMADLINGLNCHSVSVIDPHSPVIEQHLNNCRIITQAEIIQGVVSDFITKKSLTLVSPDKGAANKTQAASELLGIPEVIYCSKVRDTKTGHITHSEVHGNAMGKDLIILDDICDGGRTFTELAKTLKEHGAGELYLYVTHGIFSKGLDVLKEHFTHVFCVHTFLTTEQIDKDFLTVTGKGE
jgi:ribose-phosphate pyrophosphokinase